MIRALALTSVLLLAACGEQGPVKCTASNCSGCCTDTGECLGAMRQSPQACGASGAVCRACLPQQLCVSGACVRDPDASVLLDDGGTQGTVDAGQTTQDSGVACGARGQPCCANLSCFLTLTCQRGVCDVPGGTMDAGSMPGTDAGVDAGVPLRATGAACTADSQCQDGTCLMLGFTDGYCTRSCTSSTNCLAGSQCGDNPTGSGPARVCLVQCSQPGQSPGGCRTGYVCDTTANTAGVPVCQPGCVSNTTCGAAPTCDSRGFCCGSNGFACCEGTMCASGNTCQAGTCRTGAACGATGQACCTSGAACQPGNLCSANVCTACGGLSQACCAGSTCTTGTCTNGTCQTAASCGNAGQACCTSGAACVTGSVCQAGTCAACGGLNQPCCGGSTCTTGTCTGGTCQAPACGNAGQACCTSGTACLGSTVCQAGTCTACGGSGQACCAGNTCTEGTCQSGTCQAASACGAVAQACCTSGTACTAGAVCYAGYCRALTGGACTTSIYCDGDACLTQQGTRWLGGYCSARCTTTCAAGSSCSPYLGLSQAYCLKHCTWDGGQGDCRTGYVCDRYMIPNTDQATCISACSSNAECGTNGQCSNGFCCGKPFFRCCAGATPCPGGGSCSNGYCL